MAYLSGRGYDPRTMAGLFAAKEAVVKALGTGFDGFWPNAVEIKYTALGKPQVYLHNPVRLRKVVKIELSISHSETDAVAVAIAWRRNHARRYS